MVVAWLWCRDRYCGGVGATAARTILTTFLAASIAVETTSSSRLAWVVPRTIMPRASSVDACVSEGCEHTVCVSPKLALAPRRNW